MQKYVNIHAYSGAYIKTAFTCLVSKSIVNSFITPLPKLVFIVPIVAGSS